MLDMEVVLTDLMPSPDYVPRIFLTIAWPLLGMRNQGASDVIESLTDKLKQAIPLFFFDSLRISLTR